MATSLRSSAHRVRPTASAIQASLAKRSAQSFHTTPQVSTTLHRQTPPIQRSALLQTISKPLIHPASPHKIRHASSSANPSSASSPSIPDDVLTWDRFFDLRCKRRYLNLVSSFVTAGTAVGVLGPVIARQDIDGWAAQISGLDPIIVLGISAVAVAGGGWLCGPTFGNFFFKAWARRKGWNVPISEKERSFFARIKRYRADPASSSPQNPIPDYYGEKIASVKDYRRWLKDQRAFNLKKNKNML